MMINRSMGLKALAVAGAAGILIFGFQNCGKAGFDEALDQVPMGQVDAASSAAPFAFDATFDQITYNSCAGRGLSSDKGFFTLKAGAYEQGGVSVRPAFIEYAKSKLKPIYPATTVSVEQIKQFVVGTTENAEAQLQMSLRYEGAPQKLLSPPTGGAPAASVDFINLLTDLTDDRMMEPIFRNAGTKFNYFPLGMDSNQRILEGRITYNNDDGMSDFVRTQLHNNVNLSLTYSAFRETPGLARQPAGVAPTANVAYGRAYSLKFAPEVAPMTYALNGGNRVLPNIKNPANIVSQIQEINLENPAISAGAIWQCPENLRFTIVRAQDAIPVNGATSCPKDDYGSIGDAEYRRKLEIVRRHLRPDQWDVSIHGNCVVPKQGSCYKSETGIEEKVEYNQAIECYQNVAEYADASPLPDGTTKKRCAQFVSICIRQ